jgi:AdoMet-dependent rRNA methyltransferase SPB1
MGTKKKIGKQRRDKAYYAAKEIGYRSRASFKLIQLNRKWEFLQKSSVCIDLCAAPGSWMQVCRQNMPVSSLVIGVDLDPIKPLPNCISLREDITTEKCKSQLKAELKTAKADLVLHDGAPNVGANWIHDAYQQSLLTLSAFKLATVFLAKGGWFVTKIFRSKDYQSLMWVFGQFFKKVHATKPAASRNESAEIFVVCQYYLAPDKIDPKFLDPKNVFSDIDELDLNAEKVLANPADFKRQRQGYDDGITMLFKEAKASEFITGEDTVKILNACNAITIDKQWIQNHAKTTKEIQECLKDLKVLSIKDLRLIKKWRDTLRADLDKRTEDELENAAISKEPVIKTNEQIEEEEMEEIEKKVEEMKEEERRKEKQKRKREKKAQEKRAERINLKMVIPGDEGPRAEELGLFQLSDLKTNKDLDAVLDSKPEDIADDSDEDILVEKAKLERYDKDDKSADADAIWYQEHDDVIQDSDGAYESEQEPEPEALGLEKEKDHDEPMEETVDDVDPNANNPLLTKLTKESREAARERKAKMWFQKIGDLDDDSDLEDAEMEKAVSKVENKGGKMRQKEKKVKKTKTQAEKLESGYTSGSEDEDINQALALDMPRSNKLHHQDQDHCSP